MFSILSKTLKAGFSSLHVRGVDLSSLNLFYDLSWFLLKIPSNKDQKIWARNSYYFRSHVPGLSDIDITVLSQDIPDEFLVYRKILKIIFPWIGEVNWYPISIAQEMFVLANTVEMSRDPILVAKYSKKNLGGAYRHRRVSHSQ